MYSQEPELVDADDPYGDLDTSWSRPQGSMEELLLHATGRGRFQNKAQASKARTTIKKYEEEYIRKLCSWAIRRNSGPRLIINLDTLLNTIRNPDHYKKYLEKRQGKEDDRSGYGEPNH
jgi:hypothetical protein